MPFDCFSFTTETTVKPFALSTAVVVVVVVKLSSCSSSKVYNFYWLKIAYRERKRSQKWFIKNYLLFLLICFHKPNKYTS